MWNQKPATTTTTNKAATSEKINKEKEAAEAVGGGEDCSCGSAGGGGGGVEASVEKQHDNKTAIENNSKKSTTTFGGKTSFDQQSSSSGKQKEFAASEASDSGFISGPQSTQIFSEEILDNKSDNEDDNKLEQKQKNPKVAIVLDSGIIDEEEEEEAGGQEVEQEGAVAEPAAEMRFKQNVEAGIPQWTVQSTLATGGMNNLNSTTTANSANASKRNPTTTTTNTAAVATSNINIINAWEKFFQQNDDGDTPLHLACISGYVDVVAALIRMAPHPCLLNIQNDEAQTPLHLAALTAQPNILRMLLLAGAEPTVRDRHGNTALHLSCIAGEKQCVRALTETFGASEIHEAHRNYGHRSNDKAVSSLSYARLPADLEICNYDGERCVHLAAQSGHIDILRILVSHGADINAREGKSGRTPLHIAIEGCNEDLANFLLDECEKLNLETATYAGLTAYQVACILNKSRMQNILEKRGAEAITPPDSDYDYDSSDIEDLDDTKVSVTA